MAKIRGEMSAKGTADLFHQNIKDDVVHHSVLVKKQASSGKSPKSRL